jgi:hypothetical protein
MPRRTPPSTTSSARSPTASAMSHSASAGAMAVSSCRPPWLLTQIPSQPSSVARIASSVRRMPFTSSGIGHTERSQVSSFQSKVGRTTIPVSGSTGWLGGRCTPRSISKPLRRSRSRLPGSGRSTVTTTAE